MMMMFIFVRKSLFMRFLPGVRPPKVPAYLDCLPLEVSVLGCEAEVPAGDLLEQFGLRLTHRNGLMTPTIVLTEMCKQTVSIVYKCHTPRR